MQLFSILGSVVKTDNRRNTLCISQIGRFINKGNVHDDAKSRHPRLSGQMEAAGKVIIGHGQKGHGKSG